MPQNWDGYGGHGIWLHEGIGIQSVATMAKNSTDLQGLWGLPPSRKTCKRLLCCCPAGTAVWAFESLPNRFRVAWNFDLFQAVHPSINQTKLCPSNVSCQGCCSLATAGSDIRSPIQVTLWRALAEGVSPTTKSNQKCDMPTINQSIKRIDMFKVFQSIDISKAPPCPRL